MNKKVAALAITSLLAGIIVLGILYYNLKKAHDETEKLNLTVYKVIETGYFFLENNLWNEEAGAYQLTPFNSIPSGDDNYLAYIFHTEYSRFKDDTKASRINSYLHDNPPNVDLGMRRWIVLSSNFSQYELYNNYTSYADWNALDGIYFAKTNNKSQAKYCLDMIISQMYNPYIELIEDNATEKDGHEYYKIALSLILAHYLENSPYIPIFTRRLIQLQRTDGSWLTDDKDLETTHPNTETTILILLALEYVRN
jgi:hypothetical protein